MARVLSWLWVCPLSGLLLALIIDVSFPSCISLPLYQFQLVGQCYDLHFFLNEYVLKNDLVLLTDLVLWNDYLLRNDQGLMNGCVLSIDYVWRMDLARMYGHVLENNF